MKKKQCITILFGALTLLWMCFIWGNSLKTGTESGSISTSVVEFINAILSGISPSFILSHLFVRKLAHFLEFALLGILLCFFAHFLFGFSHEKNFNRLALIWLALPISFLIALLDEIIQFFVPLRGGSFWDVMLDLSGAFTSIAIFFAVLILKYRLRNKEEKV